MAAVFEVMSLLKAPIFLTVWNWARRAVTTTDQPPSTDSLEITVGIPAEHTSPIGGSLFSDIFKANYHEYIVCVKRLRIFEDPVTRESINQNIIKDAKIWKELKHENILELIGVDVVTFKPMLALVLPWCENGSLLQYLQRKTEERDHLDCFIDDVARGLCYLHAKPIVHGDVRGANVMIDEKGCAKLTDFGLVSYADDAISRMAVPTSRYGGGRWMAPELHYPEKFGIRSYERTLASDVFAFGMFILEIFTEQPPFFDIAHNATAYFKIVDGDRPSKPSAKQCPSGIAPCDTLWALVEWCWKEQPSDRPSMDQVISRLKAMFVHVNRKVKPIE